MNMKFSNRQKGNVLFLILIAVALFAALSYAVTQSSRSGSDASRETNIINTSSLTQYPNQVRTAVLRMVIGGIDPTFLQFNDPDEMDDTVNTAFEEVRSVFNVAGGAAAHSKVPFKMLASGTTDQQWIYSMEFRIPGLGSDNTDGSGNELIAFATNLSQTICSRLNSDLGWGTEVPVMSSAITLATTRSPLYRIATTTAPAVPSSDGVVPNMTVATNVTADWMKGKAFGCFRNGAGGQYVFYYTLVER